MQIIANYWLVDTLLCFFTLYAVDQELYKVITYNLAHKTNFGALISNLQSDFQNLVVMTSYNRKCSFCVKLSHLWHHYDVRNQSMKLTLYVKGIIPMRSLCVLSMKFCMFCRSWLTEVLYANYCSNLLTRCFFYPLCRRSRTIRGNYLQLGT